MKNFLNESFVSQLGLFNTMPCSRVRKANAKSIAFLSVYPRVSEQTPSGGMSEIYHLEFLLTLVYAFRFWLKLENNYTLPRIIFVRLSPLWSLQLNKLCSLQGKTKDKEMVFIIKTVCVLYNVRNEA
jgi:hypothetical protein